MWFSFCYTLIFLPEYNIHLYSMETRENDENTYRADIAHTARIQKDQHAHIPHGFSYPWLEYGKQKKGQILQSVIVG